MNSRLISGILSVFVSLAALPVGADDSSALWFDRLIDAQPLSPAAERELVSYVTAVLREPATRHKLPASLRADKTPRMIFASVSDGQGPARVFRGGGDNAREALRQLLERRGDDSNAPQWIRVDIVRDVVRETDLDPERPLNLPRSLFGLAFEPNIGAAFLPQELVAQTLVDSDQLLKLNRIASRLEDRIQAETLGYSAVSKAMTLYRFSTSAYFSGDGEVQPLYRGHRSFEALTPEGLLDAAKLGGEYLIDAVGSNGRFVYSYRPKADNERNRYNILRHSGTIYSMLELYEVTADDELLAAAERAINYLRGVLESCPVTEYGGDPNAICVVEKGYVKLGGNALAIIALAKHAEVTGSNDHMGTIGRLGLWLLTTQTETGEFIAHKANNETGELDDHISQYYPGEAILALLRGSRLRNARSRATQADDHWLDAAARGARWLIEVRDHKVPEHRLNHDHWLLYALNELHRRLPDPLYLNHVERITSAILGLQNRQPPFPDWLGSYYNPPRSTPTATRSEGLAAAYLLQRFIGPPPAGRNLGRDDQAQRLLEGLKLGVRFQLSTQFRPESVLYLHNPQRALGGFRRSFENFEIRIDYVQHNISALLLLRRILLEQSTDSP